MPVKLIPFIYTAVLALILIATVPKEIIRRLAIYGIIFGAVFDIVLVVVTDALGEFGYRNYEPFGLLGIHFLAPIAWAIFFIMYFYFLPERKPLVYVYVTVAILASIAFCQTLAKLGVLYLTHDILDSIIPFLIWYPAVTWGYYRLTGYFAECLTEIEQSRPLMPDLEPARKQFQWEKKEPVD
ncbi:hypothetical protein SPSYN_02884 [Sporotomaculum syntrophicum]|uniref:Uncharacterized protein n=1 Tax=Sporotomaculum syntrophicum TaxID=182264 RepID=A0A9D2WM34_9FIRM|nr:hypothetical protein [Sporotomaculum syntrophicum]KAF1083972.1 hypothetical protein SPSYN_02884 [Sporotomaculum syntrophicum]